MGCIVLTGSDVFFRMQEVWLGGCTSCIVSIDRFFFLRNNKSYFSTHLKNLYEYNRSIANGRHVRHAVLPCGTNVRACAQWSGSRT